MEGNYRGIPLLPHHLHETTCAAPNCCGDPLTLLFPDLPGTGDPWGIEQIVFTPDGLAIQVSRGGSSLFDFGTEPEERVLLLTWEELDTVRPRLMVPSGYKDDPSPEGTEDSEPRTTEIPSAFFGALD